MTFFCRAVRSIHEGGTKYYQVITILNNATNRGVVVTHSGAYKEGATIVPRTHGKIKTQTLASSTIGTGNSAKRAKEKRGYIKWDSIIDNASMTDSTITEMAVQWFKPDDAKLILDFIMDRDDKLPAMAIPTMGDEEVAFDPRDVLSRSVDDFIPAPVADPLAHIERHESWGTW